MHLKNNDIPMIPMFPPTTKTIILAMHPTLVGDVTYEGSKFGKLGLHTNIGGSIYGCCMIRL